jgi:competence protein ComEC
MLLAGFGSAGMVFGAVEALKTSRSPLRQFFEDQGANSTLSPWPLTIEGPLRADAVPADYGASVIVDVDRVRTTCGWLPASGGARLAVKGALAAGVMGRWRQGRRVRMPATLRMPASYQNPGVPDEEFALARRGIALVGSVKSGTLVEVVSPGSPLQEAAGWMRAYVRRSIRSAMPDRPAAAAVVTAILVGDRGGLDVTTIRRLQEAGTYHVIAISGGNIAILSGLAFLLLRLVRAPTRSGSIALAVLLCAYGYIAGGGPSVARATVAAAVYLVVAAADHRSPAANVLAIAALIAVVHDPLEVFDPGLALSYGATLGLLLVAERVLRRRGSRDAESRDAERDAGSGPAHTSAVLRRLSRSAGTPALAILAGTISAELALFPVAASLFQRVTLAGLILNFGAIPLMTLAQVAGFLILLLTPLSDVLARAAGALASLGALGLIESTRLLDYASWLAWRVPTPTLWMIVGYYVSWLCLLWRPMPAAPKRTALAICAGTAILICVPSVGDLARPSARGASDLQLTFLDVGQGDAVLLQFPGRASMLIDAAGLTGSSFDLGDRVITRALLALGVRRLDYLAVTHGDPDHVAGAASVVRDFRPRELWEGIAVPPHGLLNDLRADVARAEGALRTVRPDDRLDIAGAELRVLHPAEPGWERQRVRNDDSIVLELRYGDVSIVLPGDIGAATEEALARRLSNVPLRVLKAAHHGSASSSSAAWLDAAGPAAVVFSCGRGNRYGHPHPSVLERVRASGAEIFRTDEDGAVTVTTDGHEVWIRGYTGRASRLTANTTKTSKTTKEDTSDVLHAPFRRD